MFEWENLIHQLLTECPTHVNKIIYHYCNYTFKTKTQFEWSIKKKCPSEKTKQMATLPCYQAHLYYTRGLGSWRDGCHDNKHLRRVLEKLTDLRVSPSFPIFQTHTKIPSLHPILQINNSITSCVGYNYPILML